MLDARGLEVDAEAHQRILACTDLVQLKDWIRRAVKVGSVQELFERGPAPKPAAHRVSKQDRSIRARKPRSRR